MQQRELFSSLAMVPPIMVRCDGRAFYRLSRSLGLEKPFDRRLCKAMCDVCRALLRESGLAPVFAYTFSDEISLYFSDLPFGGRVEKIDSVCASYAASALTIALGCRRPLAFDARVITMTPDAVAGYLAWRQQEAWRNHINAYCQQALIDEGMSAREAAAALKGKPSAELHDLMFSRGVNLAHTPAWQRRGVIVARETVEKEGYNPVTGEAVEVERTVVRALHDLPLFSGPDGEALVRSLVIGAQRRPSPW
ncbi:MAG: tRNA(His) guanylyltransferase Thg1 family protein [Methanomicrobiaceae archaeon]|nr:tRNA(His) guanylyltransferase Thg1 family protein [Methanomicrobiaceae archaeon]